MKKIIALFLVFSMAMSFAVSTSAMNTVEKVSETDSWFFQVERDVTDEQLAEMIENGDIPQDCDFLNVCCLSENITTLAPFSELKNLRLLALFCNNINITDLEPLSELPNLEAIAFIGDNITDLEPLTKIQKLKTLAFNFTGITDLTPISRITNLSFLTIGGEKITDLTALSGLTNLKKLELESLQFSDLTPLSGLTNLTNLSLLNCNQITDLTPLANLVNLKEIYIDGKNSITLSQVNALKDALSDCEIDAQGIRDVLNYSHTMRTAEYTIFDALEILKYLVDMDNVITEDEIALEAATITDESKESGEPTIFDALEILKSLVGMPSKLS